MTVPIARLGSVEMCAEAQISYRQLDYWTTSGYLVADTDAPGQGHSRTWSEFERDVALRMMSLVEAGFSAHSAARIARLASERIENPTEPGRKLAAAALDVLGAVMGFLGAEREATK